MSRAFNGGTSLDMLTFAVGSGPPDQGPITMAVLAKATGVSTNTSYMLQGVNGTTPVFSLLFSNNSGGKLFVEGDFGNGAGGLTTDWAWYVATKASGAAAPRFHVKDLTTNGAWTHVNGTYASVGDGSGPITAIRIGSNNSTGTTFRGSIAVVALWDTQLSDLDVEAACTYAYADAVITKAGKWAVKLNQASTATSVTNDAAGGGNQTAISGTTVDADDPPGFSYALTATQTTSAALVVTTGFTAAAAGTRLANAGLAVTTSFVATTMATRAATTPLAVTTALTAGATVTSAGATAALPVTTAIVANAARTGLADVALAVITTATAAATGTRPVDAGLAVTTILAATATRTAIVGASLPVTTTLTAGAVYTGSAAAALVVTTTVVGSFTTTITASLSLTATLTAAAVRTALPTGALNITVNLAAAATRAGLPAASLPVVTALLASAGGMQQAAAALAVLTSFAAAASVAGVIGSTTPRPFTGITTRPGSGRTARPFTGITPRP